MQNEIIVREWVPRDAASEGGSGAAPTPSALSASINEHRLGYVSSPTFRPGFPGKHSLPGSHTAAFVTHAPPYSRAVRSHPDKGALSLSLRPKMPAGSAFSGMQGGFTGATEVGWGWRRKSSWNNKNGKIKLKSTRSLSLQGEDSFLEMRCTSLCVS